MLAYATPIVRELGLLILYYAYLSLSTVYIFRAIMALSGLVLTIIVASLLSLAVRAITTSRNLVCLPDSSPSVLGRPLLFPAIINHTRVSPVKNHFHHRVLFIGIPVGLRGHLGSLLSVDEQTFTEAPGPESEFLRLKNIQLWFRTWFSFDPQRYLQRGDNHLGLREKLDRFLKTQNEDPKSWPHAYLLSVPKFLWWSRSVVSWWYLYSPERELGAMIMEINNSFDEKRNMFFHVEGLSGLPPFSRDQKHDISDNGPDGLFLRPRPRGGVYKGSWVKHIFTSPFENVEGSFSVQFTDVSTADKWPSSTLISNATSIGRASEPKMVTRITCAAPPLDPLRATWTELANVLFWWTLPGLLTTPRIIFQALRLHYWLRLLKMKARPEIREGSIPRHASQIERKLEPYFQKYLQACVRSFPDSVILTYIPCRAIGNGCIIFRSDGIAQDGSAAQCLSIQPLDPGFYIRMTDFVDPWKGLVNELQTLHAEADNTTSLLRTSDPALLRKLVSANTKTISQASAPRPQSILSKCVSWTRGPKFMDKFVLLHASKSLQYMYFLMLARNWAAATLSFGFFQLLDVYIFMVGIVARWSLFRAVSFVTDTALSENGGVLLTTAVYLVALQCVCQINI